MKPILFSTPMVKAVLEGRKTQTRLVMKPQPVYKYPLGETGEWFWTEKNTDDDMMIWWPGYDKGIKPKYMLGDILWVRETWRCSAVGKAGDDESAHIEYKTGETSVIDVNSNQAFYFASKGRWKPSIFMPREAARLFLEVKNVRCQRLQDINEHDAKKEGCGAYNYGTGFGGMCYVDKFRDLWDSLNAKSGYSWASNPWVWVCDFKRVQYGNN